MAQLFSGTFPSRWLLGAALAVLSLTSQASFTVFEAAGPTVVSITPTRDAFRTAVGGGTAAGPNGSFGGLRREINWDGVPDAFADPNNLPANFFNANSPRGAVLSTPGTGFLVSANAGLSTPVLFGFPNDFQTFNPQRLFTAVNSNITDIDFFQPGTTIDAAITAFAAVFVDVEVANLSRLEFFDPSDVLIFSRNVLVGGNQGLSFLGGVANAGETIARAYHFRLEYDRVERQTWKSERRCSRARRFPLLRTTRTYCSGAPIARASRDRHDRNGRDASSPAAITVLSQAGPADGWRSA